MSSSQQGRKHKNNSNGGGGVRMSGGPSPFLMKTHQMVEDETTNEVISWGDDGASFVVWKSVEFARDLLPLHFKHNNFSSFVRQLNTYGFRKVVPDRWEFANDNFQRGKQVLLCGIRRRKAPHNSSSSKKSTNNVAATLTSTSTSLDNIHISSSTSSSPPSPTQSQQSLNLANENEKLRKDNQVLNKELSQARQQCEQLIGFLSKHVSMDDINASLLIKEAALVGVDAIEENNNNIQVKEAIEMKEEGNNVACLKLFGVILKGFEGAEIKNSTACQKRERCEEGNGSVRPMKVCFRGLPWMGMTSPVRQSSKVCN